MKLFKIISQYASAEKVIRHKVLNQEQELEYRRDLENSKNANIISKYAIQEIPLHMVQDITQLTGLSLEDLKKLLVMEDNRAW